MEGLSVILRAAIRRLRVCADGDQLVLRGPGGEHALAKEILARKGEVLALLATRPELENLDAFTAAVALAFDGEILPEGDSGRPEGQLILGVAPTDRDARTGRCSCCGGGAWWKLREPEGPWVCARCHPPLPEESRIVRLEVDR